MHSLILIFLTVHCYYYFFNSVFIKKINRCCKAPLDSNGNGAIEVNVVIIIITVVVVVVNLSAAKARFTRRKFWVRHFFVFALVR